MTREEKVKNLLSELIDMIDNGSQRDLDRADEIGTSIIKLFEQEPCDDAISRDAVMDKLHEYFDPLEDGEDICPADIYSEIQALPPVTPKPIECDDAVSRILKRMWNYRGKHTTSIDKVAMEQIIRDELPPVMQKSESVTEFADRCRECGKMRKGHWIHFAQSDDCSECGWSTGKYISPSKYCPNCGARMEREEQIEESIKQEEYDKAYDDYLALVNADINPRMVEPQESEEQKNECKRGCSILPP